MNQKRPKIWRSFYTKRYGQSKGHWEKSGLKIKFIKYIKGKLSLGFLKKRLERREERIRKEIEEIIVGYAKSKGLKFLRGKAEDLAVDVIIKKMKLTKGSKKVFEIFAFLKEM